MNRLVGLVVSLIVGLFLIVPAPAGATPTDWGVGSDVGLCAGTEIRTGPGRAIHTIVPVNDWLVRVTKGPIVAYGETWWDTNRLILDELPTSGTGWVSAEQAAEACLNAGGGGGPGGDTQPPFINTPSLFQDGQGNVLVQVMVYDNVGVASVTLIMDGVSYPMELQSNGVYAAIVSGLAIGPHSFTITAVDLAGNEAAPRAGTFKIECSACYGMLPWQPTSPDPVSTFIGNYVYSFTDAKLPAPGPDLEWSRFYNSQSSFLGMLGLGWTTPYDMQVIAIDNLLFSGAQVRYPNGRTVNFPAEGAGFGHPPTVFDTLERDGAGYLLSSVDHRFYRFDSAGRLTSIADESGQRVELAYAGDLLVRITDAAGHQLQLSYAGDQITLVSGPNGLRIAYAYDGDGRLLSMTDSAGATVTYAYDPDHGIIGIETPQGHDFLVEQEFDEQGRVTYQRVGDNFINRFTYDDEAHTTTLIDTYGNSITYRYDKKGRIIAQIDGAGNAESFTYNDDNQPLSVTDRNGNTTLYTYNQQGDRTSVTTPLGARTTYVYDADHHLLSETDPLSRTTRHEYDGRGLRIATINPLGGRTSFEYDERGLLVKQTSPRGAVTAYEYDQRGLLIAERNPAGGLTRYEYDQRGRTIKRIDPRGATTIYAYDANDNLLSETDALGHATTYIYDANGNRRSETDRNGGTTRYVYNHLDTHQATIAPDGGTTTTVFDDLNHVIGEIDALGQRTSWGLDAAYRTISETNALGQTTVYELDGNGNKVAETNPRGFTTRHEYDAANRLVKTTDALSGTTTLAYDLAGNKIAATDALGFTTRYEYDALNRLTARIDPLGFATRYAYDADGNKTAETDALGFTTRYEYDLLNRLVAETNALGFTTRYEYDAAGNKTAVTDALGFTTRWNYDLVGNKTAATDALGFTTYYAFDAMGNQTVITDALGFATRQFYDSMNRLVLERDALGGETRHEYDLAGQEIRRIDANGNATGYAYDALGRTIAITDALGFSRRYAFDAAGNQTLLIDENGAATRSEFDALDRETARTNALGFTTQTGYDAVGNTTVVTDALGFTTRHAYDALGRVTAETNALGFTTRHAYDALGRLLTTTQADGTQIQQRYDGLGQLTAATDGEGFVRRWRYDAVGNPLVATDAMGTPVRTAYDGLRRPTSISDAIGTRWAAGYDAVGNTVAITDGNGNVSTARFDALGRQISATDAEGNTSASAYDAVGNVIAATDGNGNITRRTFDARNQFTAETNPLGATTRWTYDGVGREITETDAAGVVTAQRYDAVGQLLAVTLNYRLVMLPNAQTNVTTSYVYDAVGNQTAEINPLGATIRRSYDGLGQLLEERDPLGNATRYGYNAVGRQVERSDGNGALTRYGYDRTGRLLTTAYADGDTIARTYDGNGNLLSVSDADSLVTRAYDIRNRLVSEKTGRGEVQYAYDGADNRTAIRYPDGRRLTYGYFANNWLRSATNPDGALTTYERDGVGHTLRQNNGNQTVTVQRYDAANQLLSTETRQTSGGQLLLIRFAYRYNAIGQRTEEIREERTGQPKTTVTTYQQDPLRRLIRVSDDSGVATTYAYDAAGNRLSWASNDDPRTPRPFDRLAMAYRYDAADQLIEAQNLVSGITTAYAHDRNGNRVEQRGGRDGMAFRYNGENMLVAAQIFQVNGAGKRIDHQLQTMAYDGLLRRTSKTEDHKTGGGGQQTTAYAYDNLDPIATYDLWRPQHDNLYRADGGHILTLDRYSGGSAGKGHWFSQDALGSTASLSLDKGQGAHTVDYDVNGAITPANSGNAAGPHNPFTFTGQEHDAFINLYHYHARTYDQDTATWLGRDPYRGTPDDPQSLHRYAYVKANPVNFFDAYGYKEDNGKYPGYIIDSPNTPINTTKVLLQGSKFGTICKWITLCLDKHDYVEFNLGKDKEVNVEEGYQGLREFPSYCNDNTWEQHKPTCGQSAFQIFEDDNHNMIYRRGIRSNNQNNCSIWHQEGYGFDDENILHYKCTESILFQLGPIAIEKTTDHTMIPADFKLSVKIKKR